MWWDFGEGHKVPPGLDRVNGSAKSGTNKSLNDVLNPGSPLIPDLVGLLLRFQEMKIAVQADIQVFL